MPQAQWVLVANGSQCSILWEITSWRTGATLTGGPHSAHPRLNGWPAREFHKLPLWLASRCDLFYGESCAREHTGSCRGLSPANATPLLSSFSCLPLPPPLPSTGSMNHPFWRCWGLNSDLCICQARVPPLESCVQSFLLWLFWR
jgi:hypothetical protein